jgi:hypothetical protein
MTDETTTTIETETDDAPEMTTCDGCECPITEEQYDANDGAGLCEACLAETFVCKDCEGRVHHTDAHSVLKNRCEACGDAKVEERRQERHDKATEEARELLEALVDLGDLAVIRRAVAILKRLQPK